MSDMDRGAVERWVVVMSCAGAEWQAFTGLLRARVEAFLPYVLGHSRRGRWIQGVVRPSYPGYLFARLAEDRPVTVIRRVAGVRDLLTGPEGLVTVSGQQVAACRRQWIEDYRAAFPAPQRKPVVRVGDFVAVPSGAFAGVPAEVVGVDNHGTVAVLIGQLRVVFHRDELSAESVRGSAKPATISSSTSIDDAPNHLCFGR